MCGGDCVSRINWKVLKLLWTVRAWFGVFAVPYLGLAGLVLLAWHVAPMATLAGFLALSVLHFGEEDAGPGRPLEILYGVASVTSAELHVDDRDLDLARTAALSTYARLLADEAGLLTLDGAFVCKALLDLRQSRCQLHGHLIVL